MYARATATVLNRIFSSFQNLIRPLVPTICYLGFLIYWWPGVRSRFWPLHYESMGEILKSFPTHQQGVILSGSCALRPFMMTQGQVLTSDPAKVVWGHRGHQQVFADNLRLRRARDMKRVSMCLSRQYASTDMQLGSSRNFDLRSNLDLDLSRSCYTCLDASWRGKHDGVKIFALSFQTQKLSLKKLFRSKMPFLTFRDLWRLNGWS